MADVAEPAQRSGPPGPFEVIPAIDLVDGRVVRLVQGRFASATEFGSDPLDTARGFWRSGARSLHVVDLDAARTGIRPPAHREVVRRLAAERPAGGLLQLGGGLRDAEAVEEVLALGVDRVLVGTMAFREPDLYDALVATHGARVCATADVLAGSVRVAGWLEDSGLDVIGAVRDLHDRGTRSFLVTAIERDGTLAGPDVELMRRVRAATDGLVLASGGVGTLEHIAALRATGVDGVVVGRALLAGEIDLAAALDIAR
jgi:phosphoribosylformimino-5-aminoimidazole carboxamide ribotide isomerase